MIDFVVEEQQCRGTVDAAICLVFHTAPRQGDVPDGVWFVERLEHLHVRVQRARRLRQQQAGVGLHRCIAAQHSVHGQHQGYDQLRRQHFAPYSTCFSRIACFVEYRCAQPLLFARAYVSRHVPTASKITRHQMHMMISFAVTTKISTPASTLCKRCGARTSPVRRLFVAICCTVVPRLYLCLQPAVRTSLERQRSTVLKSMISLQHVPTMGSVRTASTHCSCTRYNIKSTRTRHFASMKRRCNRLFIAF